MKKLLYLILPSCLFLLFSCQKSSDSNETPPQLNTNTTSLNLSGDVGGVDSFMVQSTINWSVSVTPSTATWMKASITNGSGNIKVLVTALENNLSTTARTATITITPVGNSSLQPVVVTVTQKSSIPNVLWSKLFGGTSWDGISEMVKTADGGFVIAGTTYSNNGDLSGNQGSGDALVIKVDANGNKQWAKLYGGTSGDAAFSIVVTADGGFVIAGTTSSNNGDISGNHGGNDAWVIKLDASGNKQWSKLFGGTENEAFSSIVITTDGGYVMAGTTGSNNGDVSGNNGGNDAWVVKMDANGNKQWSKVYGGTQIDGVSTIVVTADGGYVIAGTTSSNNGDFSGNHGGNDAWMMKLDASGNKQWSKLFGGPLYDLTTSIIAAPDGGYVMAGSSNSNNGDISGNHGGNDAWVMKLDASGNKQWSKLYGGTQHDGASFITATADGGYVITGFTNSNNDDISGNKGNSDALIIKVDANGNKNWSKLFGGTQDDFSYSIIATGAGSYVIAGETNSNDGDLSGSHGDYDVWVLKLKP